MVLQAGAIAPDFTLSDQNGEELTLSELVAESPVALVFFPLAFSGLCTDELCELRDNLALFQEAGVELLAISVDSKATLREFAEREGYDFTLLADFWPHGEVARRYGVFLDDRGVAGRGTFLVDRDGVIRAAFETPTGQARSLDDYRDAVRTVIGDAA